MTSSVDDVTWHWLSCGNVNGGNSRSQTLMSWHLWEAIGQDLLSTNLSSHRVGNWPYDRGWHCEGHNRRKPVWNGSSWPHVPESLKEKFHDMPPIFKTATVSREDIGEFMKSYCEENDLLKTPRQMLIFSYRADCMLFITPLLKWYISHGLVITKVHLVIE